MSFITKEYHKIFHCNISRHTLSDIQEGKLTGTEEKTFNRTVAGAITRLETKHSETHT